MRHIADLAHGGNAYIERFALYVTLHDGIACILGAALTTGGKDRVDAPLEVRRTTNGDLEVLVPDDIRITRQPCDTVTGILVKLVFPDGQVVDKGDPVPPEYIVG